MKSSSVIHLRRTMSRFASSGIAFVAVSIFIATSVWHQRSAVAQTAAVPTASAQGSRHLEPDRSVPDASTVFTTGGDFEAPAADAPTF